MSVPVSPLLGQPIPNRPHAVSCSLPTMRDVIGYEEKDPAVVQHLQSGYPRFVLHRYNRQLSAAVATELGLTDHELWLTCSSRVADALTIELGAAHTIRLKHEGLHGIAHPTDPDLFLRAKKYLQNIGGFLSSREAEDRLISRGALPFLPRPAPPALHSLKTVVANLQQVLPGTSSRDIILAPSGMNAFHASWRALADLQASRGRTVWIQFGWLYLDTISQLKRFSGDPANYIALRDVTDLATLEATIRSADDRFAGLVTEAPTNPLVQTADLAAIAELTHRHEGRLIIDPSLVSPLNVSVLPHADIVVNSLTKYASSDGDIIAGVSAINPTGPDADWLRTRIARRTDPIYDRDLAELARQIADYPAVVAQTNTNAAAVVEFLRQHPAISKVFWALQPGSKDNYLKIARTPDHIGSIISFTVRGRLADFYDRLALAKGPSFGMKTTLICPFIYLAHYDLISSEPGRAELTAAGIDPDLLRLSVGTEPASDIIAALAAALPA
ncbi:MAG: PLP-dependent transferase [Candidatus Synoicihabitans palmerolidicus]|nr:PLP-dependent transferase [Candidatus Synoicihabitans palmerolidicus]